MQYILHITKNCNFDCNYCYQEKSNDFMSKDIAIKIADFALEDALKKNKKSADISFYGGEPLLCKDLIFSVVAHCKEISKNTNVIFGYKMTTNGWYLDENFINFAVENNFDIALSIDGIKEVHDKHRLTSDREKTFERILEAAKLLLDKLPKSSAMMTINPDTDLYLFDSIVFLNKIGFNTIITTPNFQGQWKNFNVLKEEYVKTADWYSQKLINGDDIKLPLFDNKLISNVTDIVQKNKCVPTKYRMSIDTDGSIYPCIQYVHFKDYKYGEVLKNIMFNNKKMDEIVKEYNIENCNGCALNDRCDNNCGCKNLSLTGNAKFVSPIVCEHERMLIPVADYLGGLIFE